MCTNDRRQESAFNVAAGRPEGTTKRGSVCGWMGVGVEGEEGCLRERAGLGWQTHGAAY